MDGMPEMNRQLRAAIALLAIALPFAAPAAAQHNQSGWAAWFNTARLADRWSLTSDVQLRSSDDWEDVRNVLLRAGVTRSLRPDLTVTAGYAYVETLVDGGRDITEHRPWQQLALQRKLAGRPLTHRLRLEQRFIDRPGGDDIYSDRLRYHVRLLLPFAAAPDGTFTGYYLALQNEVFLNLSGRDRLNSKLLDQNRALVGVGRRLGAGLDLELGYMNQRLEGRTRDVTNHVVQFAVYTRR
jgi:hypothetical protein